MATSETKKFDIRRLNLRTRFMFLLGGIAVVTCLLFFFFARHSLEQTRNQFEQRSLLLARSAGAEAVLPLLMQDKAGLSTKLQRIVNMDAAVAGGFFDVDGNLVAGLNLNRVLPDDVDEYMGDDAVHWVETGDGEPVLVATTDVTREKKAGGMSQVETVGSSMMVVPAGEIQAQEEGFWWLLLAVLCVVVGMVWLTHLMVGRTVTAPLKELRDAAADVETGDLTKRAEIGQNDEIGEVAQSFNAMVAASEKNVDRLEEKSLQAERAVERAEQLQRESEEKRKRLQEQVDQISAVIGAVTHGNLTHRLEVEENDAIGDLMHDINHMLDDLERLIRQVHLSGQQLSEVAEITASSAEEMSAGARGQAQQTAEVAAAIEEISTTIASSTQHARDSNEMAQKASDRAVAGEDAVRNTSHGMRQIADIVKESSEKISALGDSSEQIGEIVSTIQDIADQTNLLALNAAIEAARAGEQGKGFAVVADEVRKLAERTTAATKKIAGMIKRIQDNTNQVVTSMARGSEEVDQGLNLADDASSSLAEIVQSITRMVDMINQITSASEQQAAASNQIAQNVDSISAVSEEVCSSTADLAQMATGMNKQSNALRELIEHFRIREEDDGALDALPARAHAPAGGDGAPNPAQIPLS